MNREQVKAEFGLGEGKGKKGYDDALEHSADFKLAEQKLNNEHEIAMIKSKRGFIGQLIGTSQYTAINAAFAFIILCFMFAVTCLIIGQNELAKLAIGAAATAIGFIFGRGVK